MEKGKKKDRKKRSGENDEAENEEGKCDSDVEEEKEERVAHTRDELLLSCQRKKLMMSSMMVCRIRMMRIMILKI
jgi:hypothetical protein